MPNENPNPNMVYYDQALVEQLHRQQEEFERRRQLEAARQRAMYDAMMYGQAQVNWQPEQIAAQAAEGYRAGAVQFQQIPPGGIRYIDVPGALGGVAVPQDWGNGGFQAVPVEPQAIPPQPALDKDVPEEENVKLANTFMIGCDPEFIGLDAQGAHINFRNRVGHGGSLGWDHNGDVLEIRPRASKCAFTLMKRMKAILNAAPDLKGGKFRAGAYITTPVRALTLGGHVHLGLPYNNPIAFDTRTRVLALDELTLLYEQLDILPKAESAERRKAGHYGQLGEVRDNHGHTEYRTMASWLFHPRTAYLCLTGAKLVAAHPREALAILLSDKPSEQLISKLFASFAPEDTDAKRVMEKIIEPRKDLQAYPDMSIQESWKLDLGRL